MIILCLFCAKWDRGTKSKKVSEIRLDKNKHILRIFLKKIHVILHMLLWFKH